jgi:erythromycin esterase-like protein
VVSMMPPRWGSILCVLAAPVATCVMVSAAGRGALDVIAAAFATHALVAVGEAHGNVRDHEFRVALIRDPRLFARVDDVLVEFGNARYQQLVDRFVTGDPVPDESLRRVWQDTTAPHSVWDRPIYEAFFKVVRELNAGPRRARPLRVLLGDPPIDWDAVHSPEDLCR